MLVERMILRSFGAGEMNALACSTAGNLAKSGKTVTCSRVCAQSQHFDVLVEWCARARSPEPCRA